MPWSVGSRQGRAPVSQGTAGISAPWGLSPLNIKRRAGRVLTGGLRKRVRPCSRGPCSAKTPSMRPRQLANVMPPRPLPGLEDLAARAALSGVELGPLLPGGQVHPADMSDVLGMLEALALDAGELRRNCSWRWDHALLAALAAPPRPAPPPRRPRRSAPPRPALTRLAPRHCHLKIPNALPSPPPPHMRTHSSSPSCFLKVYGCAQCTPARGRRGGGGVQQRRTLLGGTAHVG